MYQTPEEVFSAMNFEEVGSNGRLASPFKTFDVYYDEALADLESATSEEDFLEKVVKHNDVLYLDVYDSTIKPVIDLLDYQRVVNKRGLFIVDTMIHKLIDNQYLIYGPLSQIELITSIENSEEIDSDQYEVFDLKYGVLSTSARIEGQCPNDLYADYEKNVSGCKNDRKVIATTAVGWNSAGGLHYPKLSYNIRAQKKNFCVWFEYKTTLKFRNMTYTINYNITGNFTDHNSFTSSVVDVDISNSKRYSLPVNLTHLGDNFSSVGSYVYPDAITFRASTTGTGSNYAQISCQ